MEIKPATITLTDEEAENILITALEGVTNYWANITIYRTDGTLHADLTDIEAATPADAAFNPVTVHTGHIQQGVNRLCAGDYDHIVQDLIRDKWDAFTADAIVQLALFNDIIFNP